MKTEIKHFDIFNEEILLDSCVAFSSGNSLKIGKIEKITPKMVRIVPYVNQTWKNSFIKYPTDVVVIPTNKVTIWLMKQ